MSYVAEITDTTTGETRRKLFDFNWGEWGEEGDEYLWTDGNFGCDCNLSLFFGRALGTPEAEIDQSPCNPYPQPNRYRVKIHVGDKIVLDTNE